jgi:predicted ATPase/signal transduction histidine kinase/ActR/RegA family two-component response regulator
MDAPSMVSGIVNPDSMNTSETPAVHGYTLHNVVYTDDTAWIWQSVRRRDGTPALLKVAAAGGGDRRAAARLRDEFALGRLITHPAVLRYLELIDDGDVVAIVHEPFESRPLSACIPAGGMDLPQFIEIAVQLAEGLGAIHAHRVLHRNITPATVLYDEGTRRLKYADLSAAEPVTSAAPAEHRRPLTYAPPEESGRVSHPIDFRSDLYALGATFFHLLAGGPPFATHDPLQLIHHHLAKPPVFPPSIRSAVPEAVAAIVLKLLAKGPDDRYQSAGGLLADLLHCRAQIAAGASLTPFPLGRQDVPTLFRLPERLYGRDEQIAALDAALRRVQSGQTELVLVTGPSGSGKSALVEQLRGRVAAADGFFLTGKFEQLTSRTAYSALRQAFRELITQVMAEEPSQFEAWRDLVRAALGDQAQVVIDVIPEVERLIGPQPAMTPLGPVETQYRFIRLFEAFVRVFATPAHPLVLFVDDWQWADEATLHLIERLTTAPEPPSLLLVGAYRDSEVSPDHPVAQVAARVRTNGCRVTEVAVSPLTVDDIATLLEEGLRIERSHGETLAREIHQRTDGNPFFVRASLRDLYDTHVLTLSADGAWEWSADALARFPPAPHVVALLVARIGRLDAVVQELLQVAACLGSVFSARALATAADRSDASLMPLIAAALDAHILVRDQDRLRFLHDRVQEAAYSLIPKTREADVQLLIGRRLLAAAGQSAEAKAQALPHLNAARALLTDARERRRLAHLNLEEGRRARRSTAYAAAAQHAAIGIELLGGTAWAADYDVMLDLYELRAESEYLAGHFETAERLYPEALAEARSDLDRIRILNVQKDQYELQGRYLDAIAVLRQGLALVGIEFADDEQAIGAAIDDELRQIPVHLRGRRIADLVDAPTLDDPLRVATLRMLMGMWPSCYVAGLQSLLALVSVKIANFSLKHGNCEITSAAYVNYSFIAGLITGDYEEAYEYGRVGIALAERYGNRSIQSWCCFLFGCGTLIWRAPLREGRTYLEQSVRLGVESGNIASASYAASYIITDTFFSGAHLDDVRALYDEYSPFLQRSNPAIHLFCELGTQSVRELLGLHRLDDAAFLRDFGGSPFFMSVYRFGKLMAAYLFGNVEESSQAADAALADAPRLLAGTFKATETLFYGALAAARAIDSTQDAARRRELAERITSLHTRLQPLARQCPVNFAHKVRLIEAELARVRGQREIAALAYEEAALLAGRHGFTQDEALAFELSGRFWLAQEFRKRAAAALAEAVRTYERWGAARKAGELRGRYGDLLADGGAPLRSAPAAADHQVNLDLLSVTKASQAISSEIDLDRLLARLMNIVSENAGATRAVLLLSNPRGLAPAAVAAVAADPIVMARGDDAIDVEFPTTVVDMVARTGEPVIVADAMNDRVVRDPYVAAKRIRSLMCCPVRRKDVVAGVLYLENDLSTGVFTSERAAVLDVLLGQVAISLENARLYTELRASMARAEAARAEAERANRAKDEFLAMLGHELRNPLAPILTACELMRLQAPDQFRRERDIINRQLRHVIRLVDDLLDVSRIARGKVELRPEPVSVADVIAKAVEVVEPLLEERRIRLATEVAADLMVWGDPVRLRQVVANLLNNAAKFSAHDGAVEIRASRDDAEAVLIVRDEGAGIAPEMLPRIFDLFAQGPQTADRQHGGLGLGLTIVRSLVAMHGGTIQAISDGPGCGTSFEIRLPAHAQAAVRKGHTPKRVVRVAARRILIVDDNRDAANMLADVLREVGHRVIVAYDAAEALTVLETKAADAAILDIGLPGIDGYELARRIRALPAHRGMSLIALTGYGLTPDRDRAFDAGFKVHLTKPIDFEVLQEALDGALIENS